MFQPRDVVVGLDVRGVDAEDGNVLVFGVDAVDAERAVVPDPDVRRLEGGADAPAVAEVVLGADAGEDAEHREVDGAVHRGDARLEGALGDAAVAVDREEPGADGEPGVRGGPGDRRADPERLVVVVAVVEACAGAVGGDDVALLLLRGEDAEAADPLVREARHAAHRAGDRHEGVARVVRAPVQGPLRPVVLAAVEVRGERDAVALRMREAGGVVEDGVDVARGRDRGAAHAAGAVADDEVAVAAVGGGGGRGGERERDDGDKDCGTVDGMLHRGVVFFGGRSHAA